MLDDDPYELFEMGAPTAAQSHSKSEEWESFATHFTSEFEALKGEVEMLRTEVRQLKRTVREAKVTLLTATYYNLKKTQTIILNLKSYLTVAFFIMINHIYWYINLQQTKKEVLILPITDLLYLVS